VAELLARHRGVATDDDWARLWTRDEVAENQAPEGLSSGEGVSPLRLRL